VLGFLPSFFSIWVFLLGLHLGLSSGFSMLISSGLFMLGLSSSFFMLFLKFSYGFFMLGLSSGFSCRVFHLGFRFGFFRRVLVLYRRTVLASHVLGSGFRFLCRYSLGLLGNSIGCYVVRCLL